MKNHLKLLDNESLAYDFTVVNPILTTPKMSALVSNWVKFSKWRESMLTLSLSN